MLTFNKLLFNVGMLILLALTAVTIAYLYSSSERFFYYWDYGGYWGVTEEQARLYRTDFSLAWKYLVNSMTEDYPRTYTILPSPLIWLLGTSRSAYAISFAVVYQLPLTLLLGAIITEITGKRTELVFWSVAFFAMLNPTLWMATLRGYPDVGAAALLAGAVWAFVRDMRLGRPWQFAVIGICLACTPLFRRHFAYPVVVFCLMAALTVLVLAVLDSRKNVAARNRIWIFAFLRLAATGAMIALIMGTIGYRWVQSALSVDRGQLYSSYHESIPAVTRWILGGYGYLGWAVAVLGFGIGLLSSNGFRGKQCFVMLFTLGTIVLWVIHVRITSYHYLLHAAEFVVIGGALFIDRVLAGIENIRLKTLVVASITLLVAVNFTVSLAGLDPRGLGSVRSLMAASVPPLIRHDYTEVARLVSRLREVTGNGQPVYVIDSSGMLNDDLLRKAEEALYGSTERKLNVLVSPHIDSRDIIPLSQVLSCEFVVVSDPFRPEFGHMAVKQKVVAAGAKAIMEWPSSKDFERLPGSFVLGDNVNFSVFKRIRPFTLESTVSTLTLMIDFCNERSTADTGWAVLQQPFPTAFAPDGPGTQICRTHLGFFNGTPPAPFLAYYGKLGRNGNLKFSLNYQDSKNFKLASAARVIVQAITRSGVTVDLADVTTKHGEQTTDFALPISLPEDARLVTIQIGASGSTPTIACGTIYLEHLKLTFDP